MTVKKEGELRLRKGESVYGPMARGDLDRLLANGRFTLTDLVSVWGGPWMEIHELLAPGEAVGSPPAAPLRVLHGERVFGSLNHQHLTQLREEGRIADDDLVCAMGGPWMSVADFLSPPLPPAPPSEAQPPEAEVVEAEPDDEYWPDTWYHAYAGDIEEQLSDQWFVRVRGIHSGPLTRQQVRQLLLAGEITSGAPARHFRWREDFWRPIRAIPELGLDGM
jgi:hypothetical protein